MQSDRVQVEAWAKTWHGITFTLHSFESYKKCRKQNVVKASFWVWNGIKWYGVCFCLLLLWLWLEQTKPNQSKSINACNAMHSSSHDIITMFKSCWDQSLPASWRRRDKTRLGSISISLTPTPTPKQETFFKQFIIF